MKKCNIKIKTEKKRDYILIFKFSIGHTFISVFLKNIDNLRKMSWY